jgi:uracil phosphoribosyltransferase
MAMNECMYSDYGYRPFEISHRYGENIHIVADPVSLTRLAVLGRPQCSQPIVNYLIADLYRQLLVAASASFPHKRVSEETRMSDTSGRRWEGDVIDSAVPVVCVGIARAGTWPAQICFDAMCQLLGPTSVRLDNLYMQRTVNDKGEVCGTDITGHKIGGPVEGAVLILPDPMGATAGTIVRARRLYDDLGLGVPRSILALHLIVTPEYISFVKKHAPDIEVYALRLDRGLSDEEVFDSMPGEFPGQERGLNQFDYIVPGLGGLGEIMTNSFV